LQYQNLALQLKGRVADTRTGWLFRERLKELNLAEALFARFHELKSNIPACIEYVFGGAGCDRWAYRAHHRLEAGAGKDRNHESRVQYQTLGAVAASGVYVRNGIKSWISEGKPRLKRAFGFVRLSHSVACPMLPVSHRRRQCGGALFRRQCGKWLIIHFLRLDKRDPCITNDISSPKAKIRWHASYG
jgi:hypothetical protein